METHPGSREAVRLRQFLEHGAFHGHERHAVHDVRAHVADLAGYVRDVFVVDARNDDAIDLDDDALGFEPEEGFGLAGNQEGRRFLPAQRTFAVANPGINLAGDPGSMAVIVMVTWLTCKSASSSI